jgi:hypothetical protein
MKRTLAALVAVLATALLVTLAVHRHRSAESPSPAPDLPPSPEVLSALPLEADHEIGAGRSFGELTVFPVLAEEQADLGPFVTLDKALESKTAEVRETEQGGRVGSLVVENEGKTPIFVLAGTVVKGGKQDRQIAQDFIVGPGQTVAVDAFCVEPHRWSPSREGVATEGKFGAEKTLAVSQVRAAGQYKKDQGEVWAKVGEVNAANGKQSATGSLMASLGDEEIAAQTRALAKEIAGFLDGLRPQREVVGLAYAVEGRVRGARWFASHDLYALYREALFNTAAVEAVTARRAAGGRAGPKAPPATPEAVKAFVSEIQAAPVAEERSTPGENVNRYKESKAGYGSTAALKTAPTVWAAPAPAGATPAPVLSAAPEATAAPWAAPSGTGTASGWASKKAPAISADFVAK